MTREQASYTHGHHESVLRSHRWRTAQNSAAYLLPHLHAGISVLDIGCGPGTITADLAARVAPGQVTAVDVSDEVLDLVRAEVQARKLSNVSFMTANVNALEFESGAFDVVHAHQVLQHVADPVQALREMRRVCAPGGIVAVRDADFAGMIWFPQLPALTRWLKVYQQVARANQGEPNAGRHLLSWALQAGFDDVMPSGSIWCFATPTDREWWGGMWAERILHSSIARQLLDSGFATTVDLAEISLGLADVGSRAGRLAGDPPRGDPLPGQSFRVTRSARSSPRITA